MAAAAASASMSATAVLIPRVPAAVRTTRCSALPPLPPRVSTTSFSSSVKLTPESRRFPFLQTKATEDTSVDTGELFDDLKEKWDKVENKTTVLLYGGGAIVAGWLSSILVGAINSVPLVSETLHATLSNLFYMLILSAINAFLCLSASKDNGVGWTRIFRMVCL
uniref:Cyanobacterial aminoacyl-tRNA synthetase CAAD domain-containing protein n=1 Tax=Gossypium raimondii TaxID=29730 RepID=A0A0D2S003_GOSRA|nr:hypothetical protein B456_004G153300 [Gossypium raimondii]